MKAWRRFAVGVTAVVLLAAVELRYLSHGSFDVPYALIVLLGLWWNSPNKTLALALVATLASLAVAAVGPEHSHEIFGHRGIGLLAIWAVAVAVMLRQRWEARMRRRTQLAEDLIDNAPDSMFIRDPAGRFLLMNRALRDLRGVPDGDVEDQTPHRIVPPERADKALEIDREVIASGALHVREVAVEEPDGRMRVRLITKFPIRDERGSLIAVGGVATDISELRRTERALAESEALLRAFLDHMPGLLTLKDTQGRFLLVNSDFRAWFDLTDEQIYGRTIHELFPGRPLNTIVDEYERRALATRSTTYHEAETAGARGRTMITLTSKFPVTDATGRLVGAGSVGLDITERRRAEAALRQSEASYRSLIDGSGIGVFIYHAGDLVHVNRAVVDLFGYERAEDLLTADWVMDVVAAGDRELVRHLVDDTMAGRHRGGNVEAECRRMDGTPVWVDISSHPVTWEGLSCRAVLLIDRSDVRQVETRLHAAIESMSDALAVYDASDRLVLTNRRAVGMWDLPDDAIALGMSYAEHMRAIAVSGLAPDTMPDGRSWLEARLAWHADPAGAFEYERTDGIWIQVMERRTGDGGTVSLGTDISDIKRREAELRQAQKMEAIGQLTGGIAHDFNNLLSVVLGNLELAGDTLGVGTASARFVDNAAEAARRGAALTQRLLAFSRKQALQPRVLDVRSLLNGMADLLGRTLGETIELEVVNASGLWTCRADPAQLENAILNLAINARDAMPEGGKLTIETSNGRLDEQYAAAHSDVRPGQYVQVSVSDTGVGMGPETRDKVFEPFFTTKGPGRGSGLGLSMVYGFIKQSGGHVAIYSEIGEGTTVKMYLPRERLPGDVAAQATEEELPVGHGEVVLVVEDDPDVRKMVVGMLHDFGYRVLEADTGAAALRVVGSTGLKIDLLLTDVVLPGGMNGRDLADRLAAMKPGFAVLFMSGYTENAIVHQGRLDEGVSLLQKPFGRRELARKARQVITARTGG